VTKRTRAVVLGLALIVASLLVYALAD